MENKGVAAASVAEAARIESESDPDQDEHDESVGSPSKEHEEDQDPKEDAEQLNVYVRLFEHAYVCRSVNNGSGCQSKNCSGMKKYLQHARVCQNRIQGGCRICKRIWRLLKTHAQHCPDSNVCPVPQCATVKEKLHILHQDPPQEISDSSSSTSETSDTASPSGTTETPQELIQRTRQELADHVSQCQELVCSFPGCSHTKNCMLRRRSRPGVTAPGGCRTCQGIWSTCLATRNPSATTKENEER